MLSRWKAGFTKAVMGAALMVGLAAAPASATIIAPGGSGPPDIFVTLPGTLLASVSSTLTALTFNATYTESVYQATSLANGLCAGCVNIVLSLTNGSTPPTDLLHTISVFNFSTFLTDVGINTALGGGVSPTTVDRNADGRTVNFDYASGLAPGSTTAFLEVETNATNFGPGTVSAIDGSSNTGPGFSPLPSTVPVPEPASLTLLGTALLGFGVMRRRRRLS